MSTTASPWAGLGLRGAPPPPADEAAADDFEREPIRRVVDAASVPPVATTRFNWRSDGSTAAPESQEPAADNQEKPSMATKKARKVRAAKRATPRFQIVSLLMAKGDLTREELLADVSATRQQFNNGVYQAKLAGHIQFTEKSGKYSVTEEGREWASGGANLDNQRAAGRAADGERARRGHARERGSAKGQLRLAARSGAVVPADVHVVQQHTFRCSVASDGSFWIEKNGQRVELDMPETRRMLSYLERMAIEEAAVAAA